MTTTHTTRLDSVEPRQHSLGLGGHVMVAAEDLRRDLDMVFASAQLTRAEVLAVERGVLELVRGGTAPAPNGFWSATANPRARRLERRAAHTIDRRLSSLVVDAVPSMVVVPSGLQAKLVVDPRVADAVATLAATARRRGELDALGHWWLRRFERAERRRSDRSDLLLEPPWAHANRLLQAFEQAHERIEAYAWQRAEASITQIVASGIVDLQFH